MKTWISLLRGVNVGGNNILPMKELRALLEELGFGNVRTYIQSGNCVFESSESSASAISKKIATSIHKKYKFKPSVITLSLTQLRKAIKQNPYADEKCEPKCIQFYFFSEQPMAADRDLLQQLRHPTEDFKLTKDVFYLLAPEGIARSKLAAGLEAKLGVPMTARNYRTVSKLLDLAAQA